MADKPVPIKPPSEETLAKLLELQTKELSLRAQEFGLRQKELDHSAKYAEKALEAQVEDRKDERDHQERQSRNKLIAIGIVTVIVLGFAGWALYLNKDAIVLEALKLIGSAVIGFGGGYFYGRNREGHPTSGSPDSSE